MLFHGFQKMTLLDYPGKVAATLFTAGCNFRCPFCHNATLVTKVENQITYSEDEILTFLEKRKGLLDGVCVTGGEPLLHEGIGDFLRKVRALGFSVKLDSNGSFPQRLAALIEAELVDYVAMDIKNQKDKYAITAGISEKLLPSVYESIDLLMHGNVEYEFRTTVTNETHTVEDIEKIAQWLRGAKRYFIQPFVDSGSLISSAPMSAPSVDTLKRMEEAARLYIPSAALRGIN